MRNELQNWEVLKVNFKHFSPVQLAGAVALENERVVAAVIDAMEACDLPSEFSLHYLRLHYQRLEAFEREIRERPESSRQQVLLKGVRALQTQLLNLEGGIEQTKTVVLNAIEWRNFPIDLPYKMRIGNESALEFAKRRIVEDLECCDGEALRLRYLRGIIGYRQAVNGMTNGRHGSLGGEWEGHFLEWLEGMCRKEGELRVTLPVSMSAADLGCFFRGLREIGFLGQDISKEDLVYVLDRTFQADPKSYLRADQRLQIRFALEYMERQHIERISDVLTKLQGWLIAQGEEIDRHDQLLASRTDFGVEEERTTGR
jgi:hypothetical protein